ncbi:MAG: dTMP kinase [Oscillatoriales cyanobacterium]|nr:MAG: dTMP kinase [Oscillatoriales cyanobacterium]
MTLPDGSQLDFSHPEAVYPGRLITFEGADGAGKTTQLQQVADWLRSSRILGDRPLVVTREPGGTALGQQLRHLLLSGDWAVVDRAELLLYAADRAQHVEEVLRPALAAGSLVLSDRFVDSTVAYQGFGRKQDLTLIQTLNRIATAGLTSDLTLWFDASLASCLARRQARSGPLDRLERSAGGFHQRVRDGFATLAHREPDRIRRVDANGDAITTFTAAQAVLLDRLESWWGTTCAPVSLGQGG